jgi:hypothetical protein
MKTELNAESFSGQRVSRPERRGCGQNSLE